MLKDILAISGQPGLFKIVSRGSNNLIVESLITGKRSPAYSSNKIIALEDIAIFSEDGEVPLKEILKAIAEKESNGEALSHKASGNEIKAYFEEVLPEYDKDRVYVSDIKKVLQWYNTLQSKDMLNFEKEESEQADEKSEESAD